MKISQWTALELQKLEKRINEQYDQASKDLKRSADRYFNGWDEKVNGRMIHHQGMHERLAEQEQAYLNGKYTDDQWIAYKISQLGRGAQWEDLKDQMTERLAQASLITQDYVNGKLPAIYTKNSNAVAKIAQDSAMDQGITGIRFDLVDEYAVKRLMEGSREVRPYKPIVIDLPKVNRYNYTKLQNALLQGILQGDSIDHLADRFMKVSNMNRASAIRNARTACTGAQNAGKQDRYEDLASKGCDVYKMWIATPDERTREEHMDAWNEYGDENGMIPYDEPFEVGGEELMFPCDLSLGASGWNVYNCRCTMRSKFKFKSILSDELRESANIRLVDEDAPNEANTEPQTHYGNAVDSLSEERKNDVIGFIQNSDEDIRKVWEDSADKLEAPVYDSQKGAYYSPEENVVHFTNESEAFEGNNYDSEYNTYFHEYSHDIDHAIGFTDEYGEEFADSIMNEAVNNIAESIQMDEYFDMISAVQDTDLGVGMERYVRDIIREKDPDEWKEIRSEFREKAQDYQYLKEMYRKYSNPLQAFESIDTDERKEIVKNFCEKVKDSYTMRERGDISDMYEAVTFRYASISYPFGCGHGGDYYRKFDFDKNMYVARKEAVSHEGFAEMLSATICRNNSLDTIKEHFPKSYDLFRSKIRNR